MQYGQPAEVTLEANKCLPIESTGPVMLELTKNTDSYAICITSTEATSSQAVTKVPILPSQDSLVSVKHSPLPAQVSLLRVQVSSLPVLSSVMVKARAEVKLVEHLVEFVHLHAAHLLDNMTPNIPSTQESKDYFARHIMEGYPELLHVKVFIFQ